MEPETSNNVSNLSPQDILNEIVARHEAWNNARRAPGVVDQAIKILEDQVRALVDAEDPVTCIAVEKDSIEVFFATLPSAEGVFVWYPETGRLQVNCVVRVVPMDLVTKISEQQKAIQDIMRCMRALKVSNIRVQLLPFEQAQKIIQDRFVQSNGVTVSK